MIEIFIKMFYITFYYAWLHLNKAWPPLALELLRINSSYQRMKAVIYNVKTPEKEKLSLANKKRHDLTMISNELNIKTLLYAQGKKVVVISSYDIVDEALLRNLKQLGVEKIITRSSLTTHIDLKAAQEWGIRIAHLSPKQDSLEKMANTVIERLNYWEERAEPENTVPLTSNSGELKGLD